MGTALQAQRLTKVYNPKTPFEVRALDGVDFHVEEGEIFGLIGADGAGKTTAFKIMAGVLAPCAGQVLVFGEEPRKKRDQVGYLTQPFSLYSDLSVLENLRYAAGLREVAREEFDKRRKYYLSLFDMDRFEDRLAGQLSGGMKQKLALSCALISDPRVLLLDEPTTGVDPVSRRDFWDALTSLATEGITIVVATPYFDEAERCHRIALMEQGSILAVDSPARFRSKLELTRLAVRTSDLARAESVLIAELDKQGPVADVQRFGDRLDIMVPPSEQNERWVRERLQEETLKISGFRRAAPTLENAFVVTLRKLRGQESLPPFPERSERHAGGSDGESVAIGAYELNKVFGSFRAVKDMSLEIRYGEIYGLLGANGAGKTTAIKMICGLLQPTTGEVELLGRRTRLRSPETRAQIGYMSQKFTLYDDLTIGANLDFYAGLYDLPEGVRKRRKEWVLEISGLSGQQQMLTGKLPGGWKQRVAFGAAVMHEPRVIFLDEPTSGVDPLARRVMWRMINELADHGAAVLVVTHYLDEAEQCNRLGFMVAGEVIAQGSPEEIKGLMSGQLLEVETVSPLRALQELRGKYGSSRVALFGNRVHVVVDGGEEGASEVSNFLAGRQIQVKQADLVEFGLEDVFISLMEERRHAIPP